jgi:hypothetical protein
MPTFKPDPRALVVQREAHDLEDWLSGVQEDHRDNPMAREIAAGLFGWVLNSGTLWCDGERVGCRIFGPHIELSSNLKDCLKSYFPGALKRGKASKTLTRELLKTAEQFRELAAWLEATVQSEE